MALLESISNAISSHSCHQYNPERSVNSMKVDYQKTYLEKNSLKNLIAAGAREIEIAI